MTKRCDRFEKSDRNYYPTPVEAIDPLTHHLGDLSGFIEPCVGDGRLAAHLNSLGYPCLGTNDIHPLMDVKEHPELPTPSQYDVTSFENVEALIGGLGAKAETDFVFITNPPWPDRSGKGTPVTTMLDAMLFWAPVWFLLSADFGHNKYAKPYLPRCSKIVSVGRVKWIEGSKHSGVDNAAWYLFDDEYSGNGPVFYGKDDGRIMAPWLQEVL